METSFDNRGNLVPYQKIEMSLTDFEASFVIPFASDTIRHSLFKKLEQYVYEFRAEVSDDVRFWINGSFVTRKLTPDDIDLVCLVSHEIVSKKNQLLTQKFKGAVSIRLYGIDAYILQVYPETHENYFLWSPI